jgi:hypothetical protein
VIGEENIHKLFQLWRDDWNKFASDAFEVVLDKEQQEILESVQHNPRTSVVSGTARGKDFVAACAAMCFLYLTPRWNDKGQMIQNTKIALTAPSDRQVKNIMIPEITRLYNRAYNRGIDLNGKLYSDGIRTENAEWFLTGFKADEHNHEAWSGFHAVNTMFIVTEASGISENIFEAIEGNLQGNSRILLVFNPNNSVGYAAKSQKSKRWNSFRLNSLTAPNVKSKSNIIPGQVDYVWIKDKISNWCIPISKDEVKIETDDFLFEKQWYRPDDLFRVKVLGKFPKIAEDILIPLQWIEEAQLRWKRNTESIEGEHIMGVDVAGMGRDNTVFCERKGNRIKQITKKHSVGEANHMETAGKIVFFLRKNKTAYACIDTIGEGAGVYARVVEELGGEHAISAKNSQAAKNKRGVELRDITEQYSFANMRAYIYWAVRDWLNPKNEKEAELPPDKEIIEELTEIRWKFRSDGKIIIEPKENIQKRLGRSPDIADALANTFYPIYKEKPIDKKRLTNVLY